MKKRILAMLLALVLVFSLVPGVAIAEGEEHIHCLCGATVTKGATCADCGSEAVEWTGTNELPSTTGNYYLTESISDEKAVINGQHVALCLHGQTVTSATGIKLAYVAGGGSLTLTDCAATPGKLTGVTKEVTIQVANNGTFNMYGGKISDNNVPTVDGTIRLEQGSATSATFNMYGGEISGNTSKRGTIYTVLVNAGYKSQTVRLLGGKITGNHAAGTSASTGGGAGVLAMCPIEIGGNMQIHSNTAVAGVADVYVRNDQKGAVIISADKPLKADAKLNIGLYHATADLTDIAEISGNPATWDAQWLTLDGEPVNFLNGKFFVGEPPAVEEPSEPETSEPGEPADHIHCLCGAEKTEGKTCASCGSKAVLWTESASIPTESGYYYLADHVSTGAVVPAANADVAICLHGKNITSTAGKKIWYLSSGAKLTVTDCATEQGSITGCVNDYVVQAMVGTTFNLYGGKITGNTTTGDGTITLGQGNTSTDGATFNMYGGEISGNTVKRGTIMTTVATGSNKMPIVRILGGTITGNHATGTTTSNGNCGGAGIVAMCPVEVGGDAKIYGNTAAAGPADIYLRNDQRGILIISSDAPLCDGAQISYGVHVEEADPTDLQAITGTPDAAAWKNTWVSFNGQKVGFNGECFFVDDSVEGHIHCLCGKQTVAGETCAACNSKAVVWSETGTMPAESGYYYLTGPVSANAQFLNDQNINLCLHGQTVTSAAGKKFLYLNKNTNYNITDCTATVVDGQYQAGCFTGTTGVDVNGSTFRVNAGCTLSIYAGKFTGNKANDSGVFYVDASSSAATPGGIFTMYGGEISGNICQRGTIYGVSTGVNKPAIRIYGGVITGNRALGTGSQVGGGGIFAFTPVEVGGDAKIYGNAATVGGADIYVRNDGSYTGCLVIADDVPLTGDAKICYSLYVAEDNYDQLQFITGTPDATTWNLDWVSYDGQKVGYDGTNFFLDKASMQGHIHCLCGQQTIIDEECSACGSKAVIWTETGSLPTAEGHYYLSGDVAATPLIPKENNHVAICLHGHTVSSKEGKKLAYLQKGATLTITDCAEEQGTLTGCVNDYTVQAAVGTTFNLYGGKISGNTTTGDGVITLGQGNTTTDGATFNMYGGEISGNTCNRGTIMTTVATGENKMPIVRILGGIITGNHATGTTASNGNCGGAGIVAMCPVEVGGDAKIYGNTSEAGPADIYIRNDQKGALIISSEKPLTDGAKLNVGLHISETTPDDLQFVSGTPASWNTQWVTYCDEPLRYEDGKFTIAKIPVYADHDHDGEVWLSMTVESEMIPEISGYYVLDEDMTLPREMQISANQEVVLCLNGHTLKAAEGARHFTVLPGGKLTICDCTEKTENGVYTAGALTGADNKQYGASIRVRPGAECNLYGGKITGNHTTLEGGAFYLVACSGSDKEPAVLNMYGGEISYNSADKGYGGAIRFAGAQAGYSAATFHMEGGTICNNESPNYGGAFHAPGYATVELLGGVIENNTTVAGGGAISINGLTTLVVDGTVIRGNSAGKWGGGIYAKAGATVEMRSGEVSGNTAKAGAGILIENEGTTLNMSGGKVTKNKVTSANGGGLYAAAKTVMNISGGEVCGNTSESGGAGVVVVTATCNMTGGKICHNESKSWGAGVLLSTNAILNMSGGSINDNYTPKSAAGIYSVRSTINMNGGSVSSNVAQLEAGGIRLEGSTLNINGGSVSSNRTVEGNGGGIFARNTSYKKDGVKITVPSHVVMYSGSISYNYSAKAGSGILIQNQGSTFTMYGGTVSHNTAYKFAGAVYAGTGSNFSMHGGSVCYNTMETDGVAGVYHDGGSGNHTGGQIYGNSTPVSGGGFGVSRDGTEVYAKGLKIYDNSAKAAAGVLLSNKGKLYMEDCEVYNNKASYLGGGIYQYTYVDLVAKNCVIRDNVAAQDGGGFWSWAISNATFENCVFENNKAEKGQGGAVWTRGDTLTMIGCTVKNNTAPGNGGGLYFGAMGAATDDWTDGFHLENTTISDNVSGGIGGGLFFGNGSHGELVNMTITGNKAKAEGGALWARETVELHGTTTITGNYSGGEGYAVYLADSNFDGHSYFNGKFKMSGDLQIVDNNGGDLYLGEKVPVIFSGDGLGQNARIHVNMHSGLLTQWVWGSYNYEGGNCDYIITYGDRSVKEPEYAEVAEQMPETEPGTDATEAPTQGEQEVPKSNVGLMAGIAAVVAVVTAAAVAIVLVSKKKKTAK